MNDDVTIHPWLELRLRHRHRRLVGLHPVLGLADRGAVDEREPGFRLGQRRAPARRQQAVGLGEIGVEFQRLVGRDVEQLLQAQVREVALDAGADHRRALVVARDARPQHLELGNLPDLELQLHLAQGLARPAPAPLR